MKRGKSEARASTWVGGHKKVKCRSVVVDDPPVIGLASGLESKVDSRKKVWKLGSRYVRCERLEVSSSSFVGSITARTVFDKGVETMRIQP